METSLSVQNDAILKKAKWLIVSGLVLHIVISVLQEVWGHEWRDIQYWVFIHRGLYILCYILPIIGFSLLLKHDVTSLRIWGKMGIVSYAILLAISVYYGLIRAIPSMAEWRNSVINYYFHGLSGMLIFIRDIIPNIILLMGLAALWKNKQIKVHYGSVLKVLILTTFLMFIMYIPSNMWTDRALFEESWEVVKPYFIVSEILSEGWYIPSIIWFILKILTIYCYCKLLKTPSLMPTEDNPNELPYSYRLTKIEIGFVICVALFIGCIFLTFFICIIFKS